MIDDVIRSTAAHCVTVNRLEWINLLSTANQPESQAQMQMLTDLKAGAEAAVGVAEVMVETAQAKVILSLQKKTKGGKSGGSDDNV